MDFSSIDGNLGSASIPHLWRSRPRAEIDQRARAARLQQERLVAEFTVRKARSGSSRIPGAYDDGGRTSPTLTKIQTALPILCVTLVVTLGVATIFVLLSQVGVDMAPLM